MAETQKDLNAVINVGGTLTHWNGMAGSGGELTAYDKTPVGGPPATDYDTDVRAPLVFTLTTRVVGANQAARDAIYAAFNRGEVFSFKATPAGSGDMHVTGEPDAIGKDFMVTNRTPNHQFQQNSELTVVVTECGPTPA